ncbi:11281_t:CDS:1, partial [Entrophospora sp. SA101]
DVVVDIPEELRFSSYNISKQTIDSLKKRGIESLFPIQSAAFNPIYNGKDVLARAKVLKFYELII